MKTPEARLRRGVSGRVSGFFPKSPFASIGKNFPANMYVPVLVAVLYRSGFLFGLGGCAVCFLLRMFCLWGVQCAFVVCGTFLSASLVYSCLCERLSLLPELMLLAHCSKYAQVGMTGRRK